MNNGLDWIEIIGEIDPLLAEEATEDVDARPGGARRRSRVSKIFGRAAVIAAAAVLVLFSVLMFNAKVRAAVTDFFIKTYNNSVGIFFTDPDSESDLPPRKSASDVTFGYIPDGLIKEENIYGDIRFVYLEVDLGNKGEDLPYIQMSISPSGKYPWGFGKGTYEKSVRHSTINGMDAFIEGFTLREYDFEDIPPEKNDEMLTASEKSGFILFGDEDITVFMTGAGLSLDEMIKIAENMSW